MARPLRLEYEGAVYHVTSRGNARQDIFLVDPNRELFLQVLGDTVERFGWICHAHCLMTDHYHLLVETPEAKLSCGMRHLNGVTTQVFNRRHTRAGHVFQGRFKGIVVEKVSYLMELARYVVLNPVRARTVRSAKDWPWSSCRATAGMVEVPSLLTTHWILGQPHRGPGRAAALYRQSVKEGRGVDVWTELRDWRISWSQRAAGAGRQAACFEGFAAMGGKRARQETMKAADRRRTPAQEGR